MFRRQSNTKPIIIGFLVFILIGLIIGLVVYFITTNNKSSTGKVTAAPTTTKKKTTDDDEDDDDEEVAATKNSDSLTKNVYYSFVNSSTSYLLEYNATARPDFTVHTWVDTHTKNDTYFHQGFFLNSSDLIATCGDARVLSYNSSSKAFAWILNSNSSTSNKVVLKKIGSTNEYVIINETSNMILEHSASNPNKDWPDTDDATNTTAVKAPTKLTDTTSKQRWKIVPISGHPASTCKN